MSLIRKPEKTVTLPLKSTRDRDLHSQWGKESLGNFAKLNAKLVNVLWDNNTATSAFGFIFVFLSEELLYISRTKIIFHLSLNKLTLNFREAEF